MQRILTCLMVLLWAVTSIIAQDVIITNESERIEATILSVSDDEISYKKASNPNGPTFILSTAKVASVIYANGEVQAFKQTQTSPKEDYSPSVQMYKADKTYIYGDLRMNAEECEKYLKEYCPVAYDQFLAGNKKVGTAKGLLCCGIVSDVIGVVFTSIGATQGDIGFLTGGILCLALGTGLEIACIPTWIVGGRQRANAFDTFNATCASNSKPQAYWSINASQNGIGLALNF